MPSTGGWWGCGAPTGGATTDLLQIYDPVTTLTCIPLAWTLCIEASFYVALPFFAMATAYATRGRDAAVQVRVQLVVLALLAAGSVTLRAVTDDVVLSNSSPTHLYWFALGMVLAVLSVAWQGRSHAPRLAQLVTDRPGTCWAIALVAYLVLGAVLTSAPEHTVYSDGQLLAQHVLRGVVALFLILPAVFGESAGGWPRRVLGLRWLAWLGLISYGLYLWHFEIIRVLAPKLDYAWVPLLVCALVVSTLCAAGSYYVVERADPPLQGLPRRPARAGQGGRSRPGRGLTVIHQITFVVAVAALAGAGFRVATLTGAAGLPRVVATAVFGAALAALEALGLGLVSLGGSTVALAAAAVLTWLVARRLAPDVGTPAREEFLGWWASAPIAPRVALAAGAGAWLVWAVWLVRHPILGADSMIYHVPEVVEWIHNGRPGSVSELFPGYPVGAYPVTNEVLLEWSSALSRSFVPVMVWAPVTLALLATAGWTGLRTLRVPRVPAGLAVLTLCLMPPLTHWQKNGAHTDLPALAWLVCAAALCAASVSRPKLLTGVVLAAALAIGTKTTTLPLGLLVLAIAAVVHRHRLTALWRPLAVACGVGLAVGGYWYLRNLVLHGSPLWPFVATPWGDPVPEVIAPSGDVVEQVYTRFLDAPRRTADFLLSDWAKPFAGGYLLIAGALLAPLATRTRAVLASTGVTALSLLLWMNAPFTGISEGDAGSSALTTVRYLLPTFTVGALTICLAARERPYGRPYALGALTLALGFTAWQLFDLGYPSAPPVAIVVAGALAGAALVGVTRLLPRRGDWPRLARLAPGRRAGDRDRRAAAVGCRVRVRAALQRGQRLRVQQVRLGGPGDVRLVPLAARVGGRRQPGRLLGGDERGAGGRPAPAPDRPGRRARHVPRGAGAPAQGVGDRQPLLAQPAVLRQAHAALAGRRVRGLRRRGARRPVDTEARALEARLHALQAAGGGEVAHDVEEVQQHPVVTQPRAHRVARLLERHHLDAVPQPVADHDAVRDRHDRHRVVAAAVERLLGRASAPSRRRGRRCARWRVRDARRSRWRPRRAQRPTAASTATPAAATAQREAAGSRADSAAAARAAAAPSSAPSARHVSARHAGVAERPRLQHVDHQRGRQDQAGGPARQAAVARGQGQRDGRGRQRGQHVADGRQRAHHRAALGRSGGGRVEPQQEGNRRRGARHPHRAVAGGEGDDQRPADRQQAAPEQLEIVVEEAVDGRARPVQEARRLDRRRRRPTARRRRARTANRGRRSPWRTRTRPPPAPRRSRAPAAAPAGAAGGGAARAASTEHEQRQRQRGRLGAGRERGGQQRRRQQRGVARARRRPVLPPRSARTAPAGRCRRRSSGSA